MGPVVSLERLTKSYGRRRGIVDLDLEVASGEVFGYLGPNGAGKTTTIRILLDLIRPTSGHAHVFGLETTDNAVAIHKRTGYLPGEFGLYDQLTGGETIAYFAHLRGGVDVAYQGRLLDRLGLDPSRPYREYSKGNKQKVALVVAFHHRPDLLVLDEPTSGLDPLVQQEFFGLVAEASSEGRTVFLSSHIVGEVERCCDRAGIIREGRLVRVDRVETLRDLAVHHLEFRFGAPVDAALFAGVPDVSNVVAEERTLRMDVRGAIAPVVKLAASFDLLDMGSEEPGLEEAFLAEYKHEEPDAG